MTRIVLGAIAVLTAALGASGCGTVSNTLARPEQGGAQVIYRVSEEKAFAFFLESFDHRILVVPAVATDGSGAHVQGYWS
jgi:hypothetical protein